MEFVERPWERLLDALRTVGTVTDTDRGLVVDVDGRTVEIVMTPKDWDDMPVTWGYYPDEHVVELLRSQPPDQDFLVYDLYDLEPCATPEIPPDPGLVRLEGLAAQYPDGVIPGAGWFAYKREGVRDYARDAQPDGTSAGPVEPVEDE